MPDARQNSYPERGFRIAASGQCQPAGAYKEAVGRDAANFTASGLAEAWAGITCITRVLADCLARTQGIEGALSRQTLSSPAFAV